jgi:TRAP-type C4-dicarboxylate transport system substrate-binding protein
MKKSVVGIFVLAVFAASLFLAASPSFAQQAITLKYSNFFPAPHQNSIIADAWCKEVEKRTNGRVKVTYFPGATLTPPPQTYDSVTKGIADIGLSLFGYTMGKFPMMTAIDLPLGYKSAYVATKMINEYYKKFQPKELDEVKVMYMSGHGPGVVHTKKPVNNLQEFKGMKMRATGQTAQIVKALGGAPVGMPMTESYDALSKGNTTLNFGSAYSSGFFVVMNKAKWNSISKADQAIIEKINEEWIEKQGKLWDAIDKEGYDLVKQRGDKIIALSPEEDARWAKAAYPVIEDYIKQLKAKNLPGDEAIKWMQDYLKKNDKVPN